MIEAFETGFLNLSKKYSNFVILHNEKIDLALAKNFSSFSFGISSKMPFYTALGFSIRKKLPFVICDYQDLMNSFSIFKDLVCKPNLNIKIILFTENDEDLDVLKSLPNLKVFSPESSQDIQKITEKMIDFFGPVCLRIKN